MDGIKFIHSVSVQEAAKTLGIPDSAVYGPVPDTVGSGSGMQQFLDWSMDPDGGARRLSQIHADYRKEFGNRQLFEDLIDPDIDEVHMEQMHSYRRRLQSACPSKTSRGCHPSHATVSLASGTPVRFDALKVGDAIRTPSGVEPVVGFLHADKAATMDYHVFTTAAGREIAISDKHFLFVDGVETDPATVEIGQTLTTVDGPQAIASIAKETHVGAYHLIVPSGAYYVDGVAASTYVSYIPHAAWKVFGDGYITARYQLGLPIVPEGDAPVTLFWLLDALKAVGVPDAVQSSLFWPLIAGSVVVTELASAVGMQVAKAMPAGALTVALVAAPLALKRVTK